MDPAVGLPSLRLRGLAPFALGIGLAAAALTAKGGTELGSATRAEIWVILAGTGVTAAALLFAPTPQRRWGVVTLALLAGLAAWTAASIAWSVAPGDSWAETNRMLAYVATFAGAIGLARLAPERGRLVLTAVIVACLSVCALALFEKALPAVANSTAVLARLREPLGYWNALGLLAAMAVPACIWLGARREGHPWLRALAHPLLGLALITLVLAYSRGALLAMALGMAFWFAVTPLRLRGLVALAPAVVMTTALSFWSFGQAALSQDRQPLAERITAGYWLTLLLVAMVVVLFLAGLLIERFAERGPLAPALRRRLALAAICAAALVPVAAIGALAVSERGLVGSVTQAWNSFFATSATSPSSYGPDRLTSTGSKRGAYWGEAQRIWSENKVEGAGAGGYATSRLRYRLDTVDVRHSHGYIPQTAADLGAVGVVISLVALLAWIGAAARATSSPGGLRGVLSPNPISRVRLAYARAGEPLLSPGPVDVSRMELLTVVTVVVIFGIHSAIDWTWAFPGTALVALVCAGYVAGHGSPGWPAARRALAVPTRGALALAAVLVAVACAWAVWQPQRAHSAGEAARELVTNDRAADALLLAREAVGRDPVSAEPLFTLASVQAAAGRKQDGLGTLTRAVRSQPQNPDTWRELASYHTTVMRNPSGAFVALREAVKLDPKSPLLREDYAAVYAQLPRGKPGQKPAGQAAGGGGVDLERCRKIAADLKSPTLEPAKAAKKRARFDEGGCPANLLP